VFASASGDLVAQPILAQIAAADAVRELLQVFQDLLGAPAAAEVVADDRVEYVAAVLAIRCAGADDLLDLIDTVTGAVPLKPLPLIDTAASAAAALRRSPQITAQSSTRSILVSLVIVSSR
jgi:hypothetical protein